MSTLSIAVTDEPSEYHRFRYECEATGNKLGGLLYGRNGDKSYMKLRVTGIDQTVHKSIVVLCGTVNPDGYPHPIYLVGNNCENGLFILRKNVSLLGGRSDMDIVLDKLSLICMSTRGSKLGQAIGSRKGINFNPCNKNMDEIKYTASNFKSVRLACQVFWTAATSPDSASVITGPFVLSAVIEDDKLRPTLDIYGIHPTSVSVSGEQEMWVYFDTELKHFDPSQYSVTLADSSPDDIDLERVAKEGPIKFIVREVKKQLLTVTKPDLLAELGEQGNEFEKFFLVVCDMQSWMCQKIEIKLTRMQRHQDLTDDFAGLDPSFYPSESTYTKRSRRP